MTAAARMGLMRERKRTGIVPLTIEGGDPVAPGLVTNLHPGGNITGVSFYTSPFVTKRLDHGTKGHKRGRQLA